ncbi:MAG: immunoglobulin-like domain-containing protein, partial [Clostridia bacterium]
MTIFNKIKIKKVIIFAIILSLIILSNINFTHGEDSLEVYIEVDTLQVGDDNLLSGSVIGELSSNATSGQAIYTLIEEYDYEKFNIDNNQIKIAEKINKSGEYKIKVSAENDGRVTSKVFYIKVYSNAQAISFSQFHYEPTTKLFDIKGKAFVEDFGYLYLQNWGYDDGSDSEFGDVNSIVTKNPIRLDQDMSFSTYFEYDVNADEYNQGFVYTIFNDGNHSFSNGNVKARGVEDLLNSISIKFEAEGSTTYDNSNDTWNDHIAVFVNGDFNNPIEITTFPGNAYSTFSDEIWSIWIEYDGIEDNLELRAHGNFYRNVDPDMSVNIDLDQIFSSRDIYTGFVTQCSDDRQEIELLKWQFQNNFIPIDLDKDYIDLSYCQLDLHSVNLGHSQFNITTLDSFLNPIVNQEALITTDFGEPSLTTVLTGNDGTANSTINSNLYGVARVEALLESGIYDTLEVPIIVTDCERVVVDEANLTEDKILRDNDSLDNVTTDLNLTNELIAGSQVTWSSSDESVINNNGVVTRPTFSENDQVVYLTATISYDNCDSETKEFSVKVIAEKPTDIEAVNADIKEVTPEKILGEYNSLDQIITDLNTSYLYNPNISYGSDISFVSSNSSYLTNEGYVTRPSSSNSFKTVTFSAIATKGEEVAEKEFILDIMPINSEHDNVLDQDIEWLRMSKLLGNNVTPEVTVTDLNLPTTGPKGSTIKWESSNSSFISNQGNLTRPPYDFENKVSLTAYFNYKTAVPVTKYFSFDVVNEKEYEGNIGLVSSALSIFDFQNYNNMFNNSGGAEITTTETNSGYSIDAIKLSDTDCDPSKGPGSVFLDREIRLDDDMSFSTFFTVESEKNEFARGDGGFAYIIKPSGDFNLGTSKEKFGTESTNPSLVLAFNKNYYSVEYNQGSTYLSKYKVNVYLNNELLYETDYIGDLDHVWISYDGIDKKLKIWTKYNNSDSNNGYFINSSTFTTTPKLVIDDLDIVAGFTSSSGIELDEARSINTGFSGGFSEDNIQESLEIFEWVFNNSATPIEVNKNSYQDISKVELTENTLEPARRQFEILLSSQGKYLANKSVNIESDFGNLKETTLITNSSGYASTVLESFNPGVANVYITAEGGASDSLQTTFTFSDEDKVDYDYDWLTIDRFIGENESEELVLSDLVLPQEGQSGSNISWTSSNENFLTNSGKVINPLPTEGNQEIKLDAKITVGEVEKVKSFNLTINVSDSDIVLADKEELTQNDFLASNEDSNNIKDNLVFPNEGKYGSKISWESLSTQFLSDSGQVTRPSFYSGDVSVDLVATIEKGNSSSTKTFELKILKEDPTDEQAVTADSRGITEEFVLAENADKYNVTKDINIPKIGENGSIISWKISEPSYVLSDGTVIRPSYNTGNKLVYLEATIFKGDVSVEKDFFVWINCLDKTDYEWLTPDKFLGANYSVNSIKDNLTITKVNKGGAQGKKITWTSSNHNYLTDDGVVVRPGVNESYVVVTLTAHIGESETKNFNLKVLPKEDTTPPRLVEIIPSNNSKSVDWDTQEVIFTFDEVIEQDLQGKSSWSRTFGIKLSGSTNPPEYYLPNIYSKIIGKDLIVKFDRKFLSDGSYKVTVPSSTIKDLSGNVLEEEISTNFSIESVDSRNIKVIESNPSNFQRDVTLDGNIEVILNKSFTKGSNFNDISFSSDQEVISISKTIDGNSLRIDPTNELKNGKIYTLNIPEDAFSDRFENSSLSKVIKFKTVGDDQLVKVNALEDNEEIVAVNQPLRIEFDKLVKFDNYRNINIENASISNYGLDGDWNGLNCLYIYLRDELEPNTEYNIKINPDTFTLDGNDILGGLASEYTFKTGSNSLPFELNINELDDGYVNEIAINQEFKATFESNIEKGASFNNIKFISKDGLDIQAEIKIIDNKAIIKPERDLEQDKIYYLDIPENAFNDLDGNSNDRMNLRYKVAKKKDVGSASIKADPGFSWLRGEEVRFIAPDNYINRKIESAYWSFGDGQVSTKLQPIHIYNTSGKYEVNLKLVDDKGFEYEFSEEVNISTINPTRCSLYASFPTFFGHINTIYRTDDDIQYEAFYVSLIYKGAKLEGKEIKVELYQDALLVEDLGSVITGTGDKTIQRNDSYTNERYSISDSGIARFNLWYDALDLFGNYELVFTFENANGVNKYKSPIRIGSLKDKQDLRIFLYDKENSSKLSIGRKYLFFDVNGEEVYSERNWDSEKEQYYYTIKNLPIYKYYNIELSERNKLTYFSDLKNMFHSGTESYGYLAVERRQPGVLYVVGDTIDSRNYKPAKFMENSTKIEEIKIVGDWNNFREGYYEIKYGDRVLKTRRSTYTVMPGISLSPEDKLMVRMVSSRGETSEWLDTNVVVIPQPRIGDGMNVSEEDGKKVVTTNMTLEELIGEKVEILEDIPLMNTAKSFGLNAQSLGMSGVINGNYLRLKFGQKIGTEVEKGTAKAVSTGYAVESSYSGSLLMRLNTYSNDWQLLSGWISMTGDGNYYWKKGYKVPVINVGADAKLTMGSFIGGTVYIDNVDNISGEMSYSSKLEFSPYVIVGVEAGLDWVSVEGSVEGRINSEYHIPTGYMKVNPNLSGYITGHFLGYSQRLLEITLVDETWENDKKVVGLRMLMTAPKEDEEFEFKQSLRNYLNKESTWLPENKKLTLLRAAPIYNKREVTLLKDNVYPQSKPVLANSEGQKLLAWNEDDPNREDTNRTRLMIAKEESSEWNQPEWLNSFDDKTGDYNPKIASIDKNALLVWQDTYGERIVDQIDNSEIYVTNTMNSDSNKIRLTNDNKFDHSPIIDSKGNNALIVWTKSDGIPFAINEESEQKVESANSNSLYYAYFDGTTFSSIGVIEENLPTVVSSSIATKNDSACLVYILDLDNNINTTGDREIFIRKFDGSWDEATQITDNDYSESNVKIEVVDDNYFITWISQDEVKYKTSISGEIQTDKMLENVMPGFELVSDKDDDNIIAYVYKQAGQDGINNLYMTTYDTYTNVFSDQIQITDQTRNISEFDAYFDRDKLEVAYTSANIETEVLEGKEIYVSGNQVNLYDLTYNLENDLAIDNDYGLILSPEIPRSGITNIAEINVENLGDFNSNFEVEIYQKDLSNNEEILVGESERILLSAGSSKVVEVEWIEKMGNEKFSLLAKINSIDDNESNNIITKEVITNDLVVAYVNAVNVVDDQYLVDGMVANNGNKNVENVKVEVFYNNNLIEEYIIENFNKGDKYSFEEMVDRNSVSIKTVSDEVTVKVSSDNILEYDINNNEMTASLEKANLIIESMTPSYNAKNIPINPDLKYLFNMNIVEGIDFEDIRIFTDDYKEITSIVEINGNELTIEANDPLDYSTNYNVLIPKTSLSTENGHVMDNDFTSNFHTTSIEPEIVFSNVFDGETDISVDSSFSIKFNQDIDINDMSLLGLRSNDKEIKTKKLANDEWITIRPVTELSSETEYELFIKQKAVKSSNFSMREDYLIEFNTESIEPQLEQDQKSKPHYDVIRSSENNTYISSVEMTKSEVMRSRVPYEDICQVDLSNENVADKLITKLDEDAINYLIDKGWSFQVISHDVNLQIPVSALNEIENKSFGSGISFVIENLDNPSLKRIFIEDDNGEIFNISEEVEVELKDKITKETTILTGIDGTLQQASLIKTDNGNIRVRTNKLGYILNALSTDNIENINYLDDYFLENQLANESRLILEVGDDLKVNIS